MKYAKGWVACIENKDGSRFPNGSLFLYSEPHPTEQQAQDWVWAHDSIKKGGVRLVRMESNEVPEERLVRPLDRTTTVEPKAETTDMDEVDEYEENLYKDIQ